MELQAELCSIFSSLTFVKEANINVLQGKESELENILIKANVQQICASRHLSSVY